MDLCLEMHLELEKAGEIHLESEKVGERGLRLDLRLELHLEPKRGAHLEMEQLKAAQYNCLSQSTRWPTVKSRQQLC